jgi:opacity protein-like surface antigen
MKRAMHSAQVALRPIMTFASLLVAVFAAPITLAQRLGNEDRVQVFLGVTELNDEVGQLQNGSAEPVDINFSSLPTIGLEVETPFSDWDQGLEYGVNAGGGFSWKGDDTSFAGRLGGEESRVVFRIDNAFTLAELHIGGYLRAHLGASVDLYAGAGPALVFGHHSVEDEEIEDGEPVIQDGTVIIGNNSASDIVLGFYGRAGLEFDLGGGKHMGLGVRYLGADMKFDDTVGKVDIEAVQFLLTYSAWY